MNQTAVPSAKTQPATQPLEAPAQGLSKALIRQRFDKACQSYQAHNGVQQRIAQAVLAMMPDQIEPPAVLVDLGCGPGPDWGALTDRCKQYLGVDLSAAMLAQHPGQLTAKESSAAWLIQADMEHLPLASHSVDVLYSSMAMQWAASRQRVCAEIQRVLKDGANAYISVPLAGSLEPLAHLRKDIDGQSQVNPQPSLQDWLDDLGKTGWTIQSFEQRCFTQYFTDITDLLHSIKGVGAGANQAAPLTRSTLRSLAGAYEQHRVAAGLPLHYEVGLLHVTAG